MGGASANTLVAKLSGSLVYPPNPNYLKRLASTVEQLVSEGLKLGIIVGGGPLARELIGALRALGIPEARLDVVGIWASRINALVVAEALHPYAPRSIPATLEDALDHLRSGPVVVMGGLQPGQSTNAVAAALAEALGSDLLVNMLSGVDGVYKPRPGVPGAVKLDRLNYNELEEILAGSEQVAGSYQLFDHVALRIARRSGLKILFTEGSDPSVLLEAVQGVYKGSLVAP